MCWIHDEPNFCPVENFAEVEIIHIGIYIYLLLNPSI